MKSLFNTSKQVLENIEAGRNQYIEKLKKWHESRDQEQLNLEASFNPKDYRKYNINIWDEIDKYDSTYCIIENPDIPNKIKLEIFLYILSYINNSDFLKNLDCRFDLIFFDSSVKYPELIDGEYSVMGDKTWQLKISNVSFESLQLIINFLKKIPSYNGNDIYVYSES